jgi:hypothetical protein
MHHNGRVTRLGTLPVAIRVALWAVCVATVALLVFLAFWLAAVVVLAWIALKVLRVGLNAKYTEFELTDPNDHRRNLFYDPLAYSDDPDPRFEDK